MEWAEQLPVVLDGKDFSFERHEYLRGPYADPHPYQVFLKATQMGCTSLAMLKAIYGARYRGFKGILYLFPNRSDVLDFSKGRVSPLLADNPDTLGSWIRDTDAAQIKQVWNAFMYLRGMRSRAGLKSVPIDFLIADELDEAPQDPLDMAFERMAHSEFKETLMLSNPTLPDYGVAKKFDLSDQRYWLLKCQVR
jgi:phage terminase large subunit GpA-like protein